MKTDRSAAPAAEFALRCGTRLFTIHGDTPEPLARRRWPANCANPVRRPVSPAGFEAFIRACEPPNAGEAPLVLHQDDDGAAQLERLDAIIAGA